MSERHNLDVRNLPAIEFGARSVLWWCQVFVMVIIGISAAVLVTSYFYLRIEFAQWPPPPIAAPSMLWPALGFLPLLASAFCMQWTSRAALKSDGRSALRPLLFTLVLAAIFLYLRYAEFSRLGVAYDANVYGSYAWGLLGFHTALVVIFLLHSMLMLVILLANRLGPLQRLGIRIASLNWYFVGVLWLPLFFLIYVYPYLSRS